MTENLYDPSREPWEIVVHKGDRAERNNKRDLRSRHDNVWYVLATLWGEQSGEMWDASKHELNKRAWNAWATQGLSVEDRARLLKSDAAQCSTDLPIWSMIEEEAREKFRSRVPDGVDFPAPDQLIDFSQIYIPPGYALRLNGFIFLKDAYFRFGSYGYNFSIAGSLFSEGAIFFDSDFPGGIECSSVRFLSQASFESTRHEYYSTFSNSVFFRGGQFKDSKFKMKVSFDRASFMGRAEFDRTIFQERVTFSRTRFRSTAEFRESNFSRRSSFHGAQFCGVAHFNESVFRSQADWSNASFLTRYPEFYGADFKEPPVFTLVEEFWPRVEPYLAKHEIRSCSRIRRIMSDLGMPDEEHFFFRREMKYKIAVEGRPDRLWIRLFEFFSDYGWSVWLPLKYIFAVWAVPTLIYWHAFGPGCFNGIARSSATCTRETLASFPEAAGFSFANLFAFLGLARLHFGQVYYSSLENPWLHLLGGLQTVLGVALLYFLGLGLRNRFRLK